MHQATECTLSYMLARAGINFLLFISSLTASVRCCLAQPNAIEMGEGWAANQRRKILTISGLSTILEQTIHTIVVQIFLLLGHVALPLDDNNRPPLNYLPIQCYTDKGHKGTKAPSLVCWYVSDFPSFIPTENNKVCNRTMK